MMNTKLLMRASAIYLAFLGMAASFLPQEIIAYSGAQVTQVTVLIVQVAGALFLAFAILNWTAQANLIGGIYSKPVALGNITHFTVVFIVLIKSISAGERAIPVLVGCACYALFAAAFTLVLFVHPGAWLEKRRG